MCNAHDYEHLRKHYPEGRTPTVPVPDEETIIGMLSDQEDIETTDGCMGVEPDGQCEHGHVSWLRYLGFI